MDIIRIVWIFIFFFFTLILIFTWSKIVIISGKIKAITRLVGEIEDMAKKKEQQKGQTLNAAQQS